MPLGSVPAPRPTEEQSHGAVQVAEAASPLCPHLAGCAASKLLQLLPEARVGVGDGSHASDGLEHLLRAQLRHGHDVGDNDGGAAGDPGQAGTGTSTWEAARGVPSRLLP